MLYLELKTIFAAEPITETGRVTETIRFGNAPAARLSYILEADSEVERITAHFRDNQITVMVPAKAAKNWVESDEVSLKSEQLIEDGVGKNGNSENVLKILIEKDFVCLDRKNDPDNVDAFPHPTGKCA